ncbi:uncharacterized protein [Diabrotica undecimpunctata]|uniref:uncharacterized protein n=1 Tax=Diabrotica undecimpunctata TaxID=50387 RepID=UPI003B6342DC
MEINPKSIVLSTQVSPSTLISSLVNRYSSYIKLWNVLAYCFRLIHNAKASREFRITGNLTSTEIDRSTHHIIRDVQRESFFEDIHQLKAHGRVKPSSKLSPLNVFLDDLKLIRVGGRLRPVSIQFSAKHPVLLPHTHPLTELIIFYEHKRNLHPGAQATLSFVRQSFWQLNGRNAVRNVLSKCIPCFRSNPQIMNNLMGDLPASRVNISHLM